MADLLDVIGLAEAKAAINMDLTVDAQDDVLAGWITAVSRRLDEIIGPVVHREVVELHDGACGVIRPRQTPVASFTSIKEARGTSVTTLTEETFGSQPADAFLVDKDGSYAHRCRVYRRSGGVDVPFAHGRRSVQLTYMAGRAATTAAVDARIRDTAGMVLRRMMRREGGSWTQSPDWFDASDTTIGIGFFKVLDSVVAEFLADEMKPPSMA